VLGSKIRRGIPEVVAMKISRAPDARGIAQLSMQVIYSILLLGAEINSWHHGYSESSGDIATILSQADKWNQQREPIPT